MKQYLTVEKLNDLEVEIQGDDGAVAISALTHIFSDINVFENATMVVERRTGVDTTEKILADIGINPSQIAELFAMKYEYNVVEKMIDPDSDTDIRTTVSKLKRKVNAVYKEKLPRYLKLVETYGYSYNPLANVDADEQFAFIDNVSDGRTTANTNVTTTSTPNDLKSTLYKTSYDDTSEGSDKRDSYTISSGSTTSTHTGNADSNYATSSFIRQDVSVNAKDNALGFDQTKATNVHIEKHRRVGNIGTTMTQQLIQAEKDCYESIISEFLNDAKKAILLATYDFN